MNKTARIAVIALASTLTLLTACNKRDETATGARENNTTLGSNETTTAPATPPEQTTSSEAAAPSAGTGTTMGSTAGQAIDDAAITTAVKGKYLVDDTLKGLDISVDTKQGVVTLTGTVQNEAAKEKATTIAQGVDGVVNVDNQLTVKK